MIGHNNMAQPAAKQIVEHGTQIFFYNNIRTNQVVYSFTRTLNVYSPHHCHVQNLRYTNLSHLRTTRPSPKYPFSARKPFPPASAKTSGTHSASSNSHTPPKASSPTAACASSAAYTKHPTPSPSLRAQMARTRATNCSPRRNAGRS